MLGEILERSACGKGKFGDFFGENLPLLIVCEKICWKIENDFQFFCMKMKQNEIWFWVGKMGTVENSQGFPT